VVVEEEEEGEGWEEEEEEEEVGWEEEWEEEGKVRLLFKRGEKEGGREGTER